MPHGRVEAKGTSRSNKPTVTIGGQVYSASQCNPPTTNLQVGDEIDFESASSVYNGATVWFLNAYKVTQMAPLPQVPAPQGGQGGIGPGPAIQGTITEGERAAISNSFPALITSGLVKDGVDAGLWAKRIVQAIRHAGDQE